VKCIQSEEDLSKKEFYANLYVTISIIMIILFIEDITREMHQNEIDFRNWDEKTVTLNDFSVELIIDDDTWKEFASV
jgi:hypothetical protein